MTGKNFREIILDTETTGLDPATGDRVIEIGAVEIIDGLPTGAHFHVYIDPQRDVPEGAVAVHGITTQFLKGKPLFEHVVEEFLLFIGDDRIVAHNASFDLKFLNAELALARRDPIGAARVVDSLALAQRKHPGQKNSLDALCMRYGVDASRRVRHGALTDAELLAEVYLELCGGRQSTLSLHAAEAEVEQALGDMLRERPAPLAARLAAEALSAHRALIEKMGEGAKWNAYAAFRTAAQ
ncbi:MAG: DNA polymerase III subunit epsilon [Hyphomicrobiales bacterium]|nr:DNA polymerase III subunit epsilon [Hyphomicrobiales bacterium]